jgi:hypothetical protein
LAALIQIKEERLRSVFYEFGQRVKFAVALFGTGDAAIGYPDRIWFMEGEKMSLLAKAIIPLIAGVNLAASAQAQLLPKRT